jgi:hypothetical protein
MFIFEGFFELIKGTESPSRVTRHASRVTVNVQRFMCNASHLPPILLT